MIRLIEEIIKKSLSKHNPDSKLSFLKFSTPASGRNLDDKVIFLVFKENTSAPFLCVKTVRNYGAKEKIVQNFNNLKKLNTLTADSKYKDLFAQALYLYDDKENIFSIETACQGKRAKLNKEELNIVVEGYVGFQEYIAKNKVDFIDDIENFTKNMITQSRLTELDKQEIIQFIALLPISGIRLPKLIQHGDVTEDNILLSKNKVCIVDCDFVGITELAGFDLFSFFKRLNQFDTRKLCYEYLPKYFAKIGANVEDSKYEGLLFLYYFIEHTLRKPYLLENISAKKIISDFKNIFS